MGGGEGERIVERDGHELTGSREERLNREEETFVAYRSSVYFRVS